MRIEINIHTNAPKNEDLDKLLAAIREAVTDLRDHRCEMEITFGTKTLSDSLPFAGVSITP